MVMRQRTRKSSLPSLSTEYLQISSRKPTESREWSDPISWRAQTKSKLNPIEQEASSVKKPMTTTKKNVLTCYQNSGACWTDFLAESRLINTKSVSHRRTFDQYTQQPRGLCGVRQFEQGEIEKMVKIQNIESAQIEWEASIVFGPQRDGTIRFSVYCRKLKALLVRDCYTFLTMDDCIDSLWRGWMISMLDTISKY